MLLLLLLLQKITDIVVGLNELFAVLRLNYNGSGNSTT